ncbi:MAG TPA: glycosyltransferase family 2 protein [Chloroflexota bacterium]|nr:glycosyltransferase family 2 protein [Chloroflexota bacterium]
MEGPKAVKPLDVLIPTYRRKAALATTLAGLFGQTFRDFDVIISDQTETDEIVNAPEIETLRLAFGLRGQDVRHEHRLTRRGMAEQRDFLLGEAEAPYVLYVDDDLLLEPEAVERMYDVIVHQGCGFVGMAPIGLSHRCDVRPHEQVIEFWDGPVLPEDYLFETVPWQRYRLHNAANPLHLSQKYATQQTMCYKVAWVGACVMFDRKKLLDVGGYSWWHELPDKHCGEDVLAELLVMRRYGGCGVLPSGVYHLELPTNVTERQFNTNDLIRKYLGTLGG